MSSSRRTSSASSPIYRDRGYPDARVTSFDVKLSDDQTSVAITIDIAEGEPMRVERVELEGLDALPDDAPSQTLEARLPLKAGQPLDRALAAGEPRGGARRAARTTAIRMRRSGSREDGVGDRAADRDLIRAEPGRSAHFGPIEIHRQHQRQRRIVRRQLTFGRASCSSRASCSRASAGSTRSSCSSSPTSSR